MGGVGNPHTRRGLGWGGFGPGAKASGPHGSLGGEMGSGGFARLKHDGLRPAVVVETSPGNYQVWLRVAQQPIAPKQATMVARILVERYRGDPASVDWRHFGRWLASPTASRSTDRRQGCSPLSWSGKQLESPPSGERSSSRRLQHVCTMILQLYRTDHWRGFLRAYRLTGFLQVKPPL